MSRDQPLTVAIEDGMLIVRIGVDALIYAVRNGPPFEELLFDPETREIDEERVTITDGDAFAEAIRRELESEDAEGNSPLHGILDQAALAAIEGGCEGISFPGDARISPPRMVP